MSQTSLKQRQSSKRFSQSCGSIIRPNDLNRDERELAKPTNWGEINFKSMLERYGPVSEGNVAFRAKPKRVQSLAPSEVVASALLSHEVDEGTLDATEVLKQLSDIDLVDFFSRFPNCKSLIMHGWECVANNVMRCIAMTLGEELVELDFSESHVTGPLFEIVLSRIRKLKILRINKCRNVDGLCMKMVVQICSKTLTELYCSACPLFRIEPFHWMGGCIGLNAPKFSKLRVLDMSFCPVEDRGLMGLAEGCHSIRFLNMESCTSLSDAGIIALVKANKMLRVVNLTGCIDITDKVPKSIAQICKDITSLNLNRCIKIADKGLAAIGKNCRSLQALNVAGLCRITEMALFDMAKNCPGLIMLNVTGCQEVSQSGLKALIQGMLYVEEAKTFSGFKPKDEHIELKLSGQLLMINDLAAATIGRNYKAVVEQRQVKRMLQLVTRDRKIRIMQDYFRRYMMRLKFFYMWRERVTKTSALLLQRVWRGTVGRRKAAIARDFARRREALVPYVVMFQRMYRGNQSRKKYKYIADTIRTMYECRQREAFVGCAVRFQSYGRRRLAHVKTSAWRELVLRVRHDRDQAGIVLQCLVRCALARRTRERLQLFQDRLGDIKYRSAARIQAFYRATKGIYNSKLSAQELRMVQKRRLNACSKLQRVRGAEQIFRGRRVMSWRDMRMNVIASFVLDRQYIERLDRMAAARMRYKQYLVDVRRDSASESEDEDEGAENDWIELFDDKLNVPYWVNNTTGDKTFEEPPDDDAIIKSILHQRVRILWVAQDAWFEGYTSAYHRRKGRFKVEYDDGDHEWLDIIKNEDRVQIMSADGSWVMLNMHRSDEMLHERNKKAAALYNIDAKAEAWRDAEQWTRVSEESDEKIMFISDITGAIRAGSEDANFWTIQDDGLGFPLFYNIETQAKVFEDPRFLSDVSEDVDNQREFVMQELRYSTYFCKEMLEVYQRAEFEKREAAKAFQLKLIARSNKPKLLTAFLIRAKALYTPQSVVDKPCDEGVRSELEYASWLAAEISVLVSRGEETKMAVAKQRVEKLHEVLGSTTYYHNPPTEEELEKQRLIEEKKLLEEKRIEDERRAEEERILAEKKKAEEEEAAAAAVAEAEAAAAAAAEALASRKVKRQSSKKSVAESPKSSVKKRKPVRRAPSQKKL